MNNFNQSICTEAEHIYTNQFFASAQVLVITLNISGIIQCTFITFFVASVQVFHINFRILFFNLSIAIIIRSILTLYRSSRYLVNIISFNDSCELVAREHFCFIQSVVNKTPLEASAFCFLAIALERLLAYLVYCRYERCRLPAFGVFLALLPWLYPSVKMINQLTSPMQPNIYLAYCSSLTSSAIRLPTLLYISMPSVILCFILCVIILIFSKRRLTLRVTGQMQSLSSRFQLKENIRSSKLLAIASFAYTITSLSDMSIVLIMNRILVDDCIKNAKLWQAIVKEFASLSMPIFINIYSLIFISGHRYFKHRTISLLCCRRLDNKKSESKIAPPMSIYTHMEIVAKIWDNKR